MTAIDDAPTSDSTITPSVIAAEIEDLVANLVDSKVCEKETEIRAELKPKSRWKSKIFTTLLITTLAVSVYLNYKKGITIDDVVSEGETLVELVTTTMHQK